MLTCRDQGNLIYLQGLTGKSLEILQIGQGNFKCQESLGKVREKSEKVTVLEKSIWAVVGICMKKFGAKKIIIDK